MRNASPRVLIAIFVAVACSGEGATAPKAPIAAQVQIIEGTPQTHLVGSTSDTMVIRVLDNTGTPLSGASVAWTTSAGALVNGGTVTDADGRTGNRLASVGTIAGTITVTARTQDVTGSFVITVTVGEPAALARVADLQTGMAAGTADSIRVRVNDQYGNPVGGIEVAFSVTEGAGSISGSPATTNGQGVAAAQFLTGSIIGPNTAAATSAAVAGATVLFSVTTTPGPAATLAKVGDLTPVMVAGSADSLRVLVTDAHGNLRPNAAVSFQATAGGGVLEVNRPGFSRGWVS